jgi:hypothetical protein
MTTDARYSIEAQTSLSGEQGEWCLRRLALFQRIAMWLPSRRGLQWNYTSILNIIFLVLAAILVIRFLRTGGLPMLKMMNRPEHAMEHHDMESHAMGHHGMTQ